MLPNTQLAVTGQPVHGELLICPEFCGFSVSCYDEEMRDLVILFVHLITTLVRLAGPGGVPPVVRGAQCAETAWERFGKELRTPKTELSRTESTGRLFLYVLITRRSSVQI